MSESRRRREDRDADINCFLTPPVMPTCHAELPYLPLPCEASDDEEEFIFIEKQDAENLEILEENLLLADSSALPRSVQQQCISLITRYIGKSSEYLGCFDVTPFRLACIGANNPDVAGALLRIVLQQANADHRRLPPKDIFYCLSLIPTKDPVQMQNTIVLFSHASDIYSEEKALCRKGLLELNLGGLAEVEDEKVLSKPERSSQTTATCENAGSAKLQGFRWFCFYVAESASAWMPEVLHTPEGERARIVKLVSLPSCRWTCVDFLLQLALLLEDLATHKLLAAAMFEEVKCFAVQHSSIPEVAALFRVLSLKFANNDRAG